MSKVVIFPAQKSRQSASGYYSLGEAARIARVPLHRLYAWRREGIILPTVAVTIGDERESTGYSFDALIYLRLLRMLRDQSIPLEKAVGAVQHLRDRFGPPGPNWENARVFLQGRDVFVDSKDVWEVTAATRKGQKAAVLLMGEEFAQLRDRADALLIPQRFQPMVEIDPEVRSGLPIIKETTIQTGVIYRLRERGLSLVRIREHYPHLNVEQIKGAIGYERFLDSEAA